MKKGLAAIAIFVFFLSYSLPAAGQYSVNDRLLLAIMNGDTATVQAMLDKGASLDEARSIFSDWDRPLAFALRLNKPDIVIFLLDKGADINYNGGPLGDGQTPLLTVVCSSKMPGNQKISLVKLLLNRGANIDVEDGNHVSPLDCANDHGPAELVDLLLETSKQRELLKQAEQKEPTERLEIYTSALHVNPQDESLREKIIQVAATLPTPPAIPDAAQQLFVTASDQIKQTSTPAELDQPIGLLRKALEIAPWWGNAYYNLSLALEMRGQYDDAIRQLNYYLELKPPEADASKARAHLAVLQTEKNVAAGKQQ